MLSMDVLLNIVCTEAIEVWGESPSISDFPESVDSDSESVSSVSGSGVE